MYFRTLKELTRGVQPVKLTHWAVGAGVAPLPDLGLRAESIGGAPGTFAFLGLHRRPM